LRFGVIDRYNSSAKSLNREDGLTFRVEATELFWLRVDFELSEDSSLSRKSSRRCFEELLKSDWDFIFNSRFRGGLCGKKRWRWKSSKEREEVDDKEIGDSKMTVRIR
jgi:hypothetical protein